MLELFRLVEVTLLQMSRFTMSLIPILGVIKFPDKTNFERKNLIYHNASKHRDYKKIADLKSKTI